MKTSEANLVNVGGETVRVSKYHRADLAFASAASNNGTRKMSALGNGGAQRVVLGDIDDPFGAFWVADCNRSASILVKAGFDYAC
jgi:hypothetical protein